MKLKWTVEFEVDYSWFEDGFDLTDEKAFEIINAVLRWANSDELSAKVLTKPTQKEIEKARQEFDDYNNEA